MHGAEQCRNDCKNTILYNTQRSRYQRASCNKEVGDFSEASHWCGRAAPKRADRERPFEGIPSCCIERGRPSINSTILNKSGKSLISMKSAKTPAAKNIKGMISQDLLQRNLKMMKTEVHSSKKLR
jgi:hypothetical protein